MPLFLFVKVAITVDEKESKTLPGRKKENGDNKDKYYNVTVECTSSNGKEGDKPVQGTWDYNAWNLKLENVTSGTKCKLKFTSDLNGEEYKKHLEEGIALRRNTYRGKDISYVLKGDDNKKKFYESISSGEFGDIYVGDYIESPSNQTYNGTGTDTNEKVRWLIADIDNYRYTGCNGTGCPSINGSTDGILKSHHVTIIPAKPLETQKKMNDKDTTQCGYAGSDMVGILTKGSDNNCTPTEDQTGLGGTNSTLHKIYNDYISKDFTDHVIPYQNLLTNAMEQNRTNRFGQGTGASSNWAWYPRKLDLMSEMNVYGGIVASSSVWDTGIDNRQYAIFRLKPELINSYGGQQLSDYWLKDVASSSFFAFVDSNGHSFAYYANSSVGVRPRFLIGVSSLKK